MKTVKITKDQLRDFGMKETEDVEKMFTPMKKVISVPNDEGELAICVTNQRNVAELCLILPDGGCLYLSPESMDDLKIFEKCITSYEPAY